MKILSIQYFIADKYKVDPYVYRKAELLVQTSFLTSAFSGFYFLQTYYLHMQYAQIAMLYNSLSFLLIPFLFRWGLSAVWAANLYTFTGFVGVGVCVLVQNILETSTIIWFALLPVVSLMLSDKFSARVWTGIACLVVLIFGFIHQQHLIVIDEAPPEYNTFLEVSNITGFILIVFLVVMVFQKTTDSTLETINEKNKLLEIEKQRSEQSFEELKAAQSQLIEAEKMASLGELTAGIAHEIQNPLNFVNNFSEVNTELIDEMEEALQKDDRAEVVSIATAIKDNMLKIVTHGKRADGIVKAMLQHSRTSTGKKELTDINVLATEYLKLSYHGLRAKDKSFNATFETSFDDSIGKIKLISQDIGRVLLNLFNNAFYSVNEKKKASILKKENYNPTIWLTTRAVKSTLGTAGIELSVKDNGVGIPRGVLDKIYQPFFTTKPTGQGTGLGLSLSYDIIKAHDGELKVETKEGEGAEFIITFFNNQDKEQE